MNAKAELIRYRKMFQYDSLALDIVCGSMTATSSSWLRSMHVE